MKFLCDQMCIELGRWLRAAGYDALVLEPTLSDQEMLNSAGDRLVLTKDRRIEGANVIQLKGQSLDAFAHQLKEELGVNWLLAPFSRCIKCDAVFQKVDDTFWYCPRCQQLFWLGSHTEHMLDRLKRWQNVS